MPNQSEIAYALKDKDYFHSLPSAEQEAVLAAGGIGASDISDDILESISSGLEGGAAPLYTGTDAQIGQNGPRMVICTC